MRMSATQIGGDSGSKGGGRTAANASDLGSARTGRASFFRVGLRVWKSDGLRGFYRGIVPTSVGAIPYEGIKFGVFDLLRSVWISQVGSRAEEESSSPEDGLDETSSRNAGAEVKMPIVAKLACGALAGIAGGAVMYPNDTVRRRMQVAGAMQGSEGDRVFSGPLDCACDTYRRGGVRRFYRGIGPYLVRMVPNAAIQFAVYESLKDYLVG